MADRSFNQQKLQLLKREVTLWASISVAAGSTTPVLGRWTYPSLGAGGLAYVAAPVVAAPPTGTGSWPKQTTGGDAGVFSVARTAAGLWTLTLQDSYQRLMGIRGHMTLAGGAANIVSIAENSTITNMVARVPGSVIGVALLSATATLADPTGPCTITLELELNDASEA